MIDQKLRSLFVPELAEKTETITEAAPEFELKHGQRLKDVWEGLKANPDMTSVELARKLTHLPFNGVSSALSRLYFRNMVTIVGKRKRAAIYRVAMDEYELRPLNPKLTNTAAMDLEDGYVAPTPVEQPTIIETKPVVIDVDSLTVKQAREMYKQLQGLFG